MQRIASFTVNHDFIRPGVYISRVDGDVVTYDLRTRRPNGGDYMSPLVMHSVEHLFATYVRNSAWGDKVIYFGPMGCRTGFYLLLRDLPAEQVKPLLVDTLRRCIAHKGRMPGASRQECGNFRGLSLAAGQEECRRFLAVVEKINSNEFAYPKE